MEQSTQTLSIAPVASKGTLIKKAKSEFTKIRRMTLAKLNKFKQTGKCFAISSYALGEGVFRSFVEDIYKNGSQEVVVVKWYDKNNMPSSTHLFLEEILTIIPIEKHN